MRSAQNAQQQHKNVPWIYKRPMLIIISIYQKRVARCRCNRNEASVCPKHDPTFSSALLIKVLRFTSSRIQRKRRVSPHKRLHNSYMHPSTMRRKNRTVYSPLSWLACRESTVAGLTTTECVYASTYAHPRQEAKETEPSSG